ncbi:MAG: ATP-binding protein [Cellvibrionaceae bacterium]|nr:ATP-binding protein [Cellvibrionaceae bacterium]
MAAYSEDWQGSSERILKIFSYYRLALSGLLLLMFVSGISGEFLGSSYQQLYYRSNIAYCALAVVSLAYLWWRNPKLQAEQVFTLFFIDLVFLGLLSYSSGGSSSGLGYLFFVSVITASLFIQGRRHYALAATASIILLGIELVKSQTAAHQIFSAGAIGALLFLVSAIFQSISRRLRLSEQQVLKQQSHADYLQRLTHRIVARLYTGVIVVNAKRQVEIINQSALSMLTEGKELPPPPFDIALLPAEIVEQYKIWRRHRRSLGQMLQLREPLREVRIGFVQQDDDSLIFIDDSRLVQNQAQQLKLASLGRLTASIAHEVRNPLGALSHANQLLQESPDIPQHERRLTEIIDNHCQRVNGIIESVLQLSRRQAPNLSTIELDDWVGDFCQRYRAEHGGQIEYRCKQQGLSSKLDSHQLFQILSNLVDNGLRYSQAYSQRNEVQLNLDQDPRSGQPIIEVIDYGPGIAEADISKLFEPFYTTHNAGSGLGLYLVKELCDANQIHVSIPASEPGRTCFKLRFPNPEATLQ